MVAVPGVTPVTTPELEPTVATPILPLTHVPPGVPLLRVTVLPRQMAPEALMAPGVGFIVSTCVAAQRLTRSV